MKKLREGFTTGSCAAAAALACCLWLRDGECPARVEIVVPEGRSYAPEIAAHPDGSCGVIKDSGDDPDVTNGMEVRAKVELLPGETKSCRVTVPDGQLSLAIGNKGQNARLAAKLTGWKIDIRPESGFYGEDEPETPAAQ